VNEYLPYGIVWPEPFGLPLVTRAPGGDATGAPPTAQEGD
jgi:hypothetical protein